MKTENAPKPDARRRNGERLARRGSFAFKPKCISNADVPMKPISHSFLAAALCGFFAFLIVAPPAMHAATVSIETNTFTIDTRTISDAIAFSPGTMVVYQGYSLNSSGGAAFAATLAGATVPGGISTGIWMVAPGSSLIPVARTGGVALGASAGSVFSSLGNPAFNDAGRVAFVGMLNGPGGPKSGVWLHTGGLLAPLAISGNAAPKCPKAKFASFTRVMLPTNGRAVMIASLVRGGRVNAANNMGIWVGDNLKTMKLLLRKGQTISLGGVAKVVTKLSAFNASANRGESEEPGAQTPAPAEPDSERAQEDPMVVSSGDERYMNSAGTLVLQAQFGDSTTGIFTARQNGRFKAVAWRNGVASGIKEAIFNKLGNPVINDAGQTAFFATVKGPGVNSANNAGIWSNGKLIVRTGVTTPGVGVFTQLGNPVTNSLGGVAFPGTLKNGDAGIWWRQGGVLRTVATSAMLAPGCNGARFQSFSHVVLPDVGGPVFQASLVIGTGDATASSSVGIWAVGANGLPQLLARQGQLTLDSQGAWRTVIGGPEFTGKPCSYTRLGDVIYKVTLDTGSQALYQAKLP